jgi:hypothetical protein
MPHKVKRSPRLQVTLSPEANDFVGRVAMLTKQSKSSIASELLDLALPALETMAEAMQVVKDTPLEAQRIMTRFAAQATGELAQAQLDLDSAIDTRTMKGKRITRAKRVAQT